MCGRYAVHRDPAALAAEFAVADKIGAHLGPDFNVTPARTVPIVVQRGAERSLRPVQWGLLPEWAADDAKPLINARAETLTSKPAFAEAAARRRCLVPATGWYEWQPGRRQPFLCTGRDGDASLAMAAVFTARWVAGRGDPLVTCAVVTTAAVGRFAEIHPRMPLVLPSRQWAEWLDPERAEIDELLAPVPDMLADITVQPASVEVNNMRNNHPGLLDPAAAEPDPAVQTALFES